MQSTSRPMGRSAFPACKSKSSRAFKIEHVSKCMHHRSCQNRPFEISAPWIRSTNKHESLNPKAESPTNPKHLNQETHRGPYNLSKLCPKRVEPWSWLWILRQVPEGRGLLQGVGPRQHSPTAAPNPLAKHQKFQEFLFLEVQGFNLPFGYLIHV